MAKDPYSDRCWGWGERLGIALEWAADRSWGALKRYHETQHSSAGATEKLV